MIIITALYEYITSITLTSLSISSRRKCNSTNRDLCDDNSTNSFRRCSAASAALSDTTTEAVVLAPPLSVGELFVKNGDVRCSHVVVDCHDGDKGD